MRCSKLHKSDHQTNIRILEGLVGFGDDTLCKIADFCRIKKNSSSKGNHQAQIDDKWVQIGLGILLRYVLQGNSPSIPA